MPSAYREAFPCLAGEPRSSSWRRRLPRTSAFLARLSSAQVHTRKSTMYIARRVLRRFRDWGIVEPYAAASERRELGAPCGHLARRRPGSSRVGSAGWGPACRQDLYSTSTATKFRWPRVQQATAKPQHATTVGTSGRLISCIARVSVPAVGIRPGNGTRSKNFPTPAVPKPAADGEQLLF